MGNEKKLLRKEVTEAERLEFSDRARMAVNNAIGTCSPTRVAEQFNLRYGGAPVTIHAVRKWLNGHAIPTQDKLRALARMLHVPINWLRFGDGKPDDREEEFARGEQLPIEDLMLLDDLKSLDELDRRMVDEIVKAILQASKKRKAQLNKELGKK